MTTATTDPTLTSGRSQRAYELHRSLVVPESIDKVFDFFSAAENLQRLTPDWLGFRILTPLPIEMAEDTLIDYRISLRGLPMRWRTRIAAWQPPHRFIDEQLRGPYRMWVHEHRFEPTPEGTRCIDHVRYAVPGGPIAPLIHRWMVRSDVEAIFDFREQQMRAIFNVAD